MTWALRSACETRPTQIPRYPARRLIEVVAHQDGDNLAQREVEDGGLQGVDEGDSAP